MHQELCKPKALELAEKFHVQSVHAEWDGKKSEAQKYGRLCADEYLKALYQGDFEPEFKISLYWRAVIQHRDVRRHKVAVDLAKDALSLIATNENLEKHRVMFEAFLNNPQ